MKGHLRLLEVKIFEEILVFMNILDSGIKKGQVTRLYYSINVCSVIYQEKRTVI